MKTHTPHLRRLNSKRDAQALHAILGDETSCLYLPRPHLKSVAETLAQLEKWDADPNALSWAIINKEDGPALGRISVFPVEDGIWEVAVMTVPSATQQGLTSKALGEALDILYAVHNPRRIFADCDPDNIAAIRLFERLGFINEGRLRATWETHIGIRDSVILALTQTDKRLWKPSQPQE